MSAISAFSVGNGPSPTRVVYAFITPTTRSIRCGGTPEPVQAPPAVVFDEVTNGYVPWSMSRNVPCAPSNKISLPRRLADHEVVSDFNAELAEALNFRDQSHRINHHAIADDAELVLAQDARRHEMQDVFLRPDEN